MTYQTRVSALLVGPPDEPTFSELVSCVRIENEAAGEFVVVEQEGRDSGSIAITPEEWPALRDAIDRMIAECRPVKESKP